MKFGIIFPNAFREFLGSLTSITHKIRERSALNESIVLFTHSGSKSTKRFRIHTFVPDDTDPASATATRVRTMHTFSLLKVVGDRNGMADAWGV